jgi:hypothetical protein
MNARDILSQLRHRFAVTTHLILSQQILLISVLSSCAEVISERYKK